MCALQAIYPMTIIVLVAMNQSLLDRVQESGKPRAIDGPHDATVATVVFAPNGHEPRFPRSHHGGDSSTAGGGQTQSRWKGQIQDTDSAV